MVHSEQNIRVDAHPGSVAQNDLELLVPTACTAGMTALCLHTCFLLFTPHLFLETWIAGLEPEM